MKSLLRNLLFYVMVMVLPLLFLPFGVNLVRYATANECRGEQISAGRDCIGRLTVEVAKTDAVRVPYDVCDQDICTTEYRDKHFMQVRLPDGSEQSVKGNDTFDGFTPGEKIDLYSWNGRFIRANDGRPDHDIGLNAWYPGWMTLTLIGAVLAWLMVMYPIYCWARDKYLRRTPPQPITKQDTVMGIFAPIATLGAIGFLLVYGITSRMLL